jgi:hypothetical protein
MIFVYHATSSTQFFNSIVRPLFLSSPNNLGKQMLHQPVQVLKSGSTIHCGIQEYLDQGGTFGIKYSSCGALNIMQRILDHIAMGVALYPIFMRATHENPCFREMYDELRKNTGSKLRCAVDLCPCLTTFFKFSLFLFSLFVCSRWRFQLDPLTRRY